MEPKDKATFQSKLSDAKKICKKCIDTILQLTNKEKQKQDKDKQIINNSC